MRGAEGPRKILSPMPSDTEGENNARGGPGKRSWGQGGLEVGAVVRRLTGRGRGKMAGAGGGGVWSPSGQGPCRVDPTALPRLAGAWIRVRHWGLCGKGE